MTTRLAEIDDLPELCALLEALFQQEAEFAADRTKQEAGLRLILENPGIGRIMVGCIDGRVVGMVNLLYVIDTSIGRQVAVLEDMIVHPGYRGKGMGSLLLDSALQHAQHAGCGRITLLTDAVNASAIRFYEKSGYSRSGMMVLRLMITQDPA